MAWNDPVRGTTVGPRDPENVLVLARMMFPASVHVLRIVSSEDDIIPPHFFKNGETITMEVYLWVLKTVVSLDGDCGLQEAAYHSFG